MNFIPPKTYGEDIPVPPREDGLHRLLSRRALEHVDFHEARAQRFGDGKPGCTCFLCESLPKMREQAALINGRVKANIEELDRAFGSSTGTTPQFTAEAEGDDYLFGKPPAEPEETRLAAVLHLLAVVVIDTDPGGGGPSPDPPYDYPVIREVRVAGLERGKHYNHAAELARYDGLDDFDPDGRLIDAAKRALDDRGEGTTDD